VTRIDLSNQPLQRIVIVRALRGLGDFLCAVPAWRALRSALPTPQITLIGLSEVRGLVNRFSRYLDELVEFPGYPGIIERDFAPRDFPAFLSAMHQRHFDLAIQMHGSGIITNLFTALLGARQLAGFYLPGHYCPDPRHCLPYPETEPEVHRHLSLMEHLGIPLQGSALEFPINPEDWHAFHQLERHPDLQPGAYICLHPGAQDPARRWPPKHFASVADTLAAWGLQIVLTGTASEAPLTAAVARAMHHPALDLTGQTSLGVLAALLSQARLLVCNDTGVSHLAAALSTPSVILFLASDPERWAPLNRQRHRAVGSGIREVGPLTLKSRPTVRAVLAEAELLLSEELTHVA
jgi:ADP-heptose:LPS heptosyltransferase